MIGKLNHVAIAVPNLKEATALYKNTLGAEVSKAKNLPKHGVKVVFVNMNNISSKVEHRKDGLKLS